MQYSSSYFGLQDLSLKQWPYATAHSAQAQTVKSIYAYILYSIRSVFHFIFSLVYFLKCSIYLGLHFHLSSLSCYLDDAYLAYLLPS